MTIPEEAQDLIGSHYRAPDYFEVGREKIREFALAVKDDHPSHFSEADPRQSILFVLDVHDHKRF